MAQIILEIPSDAALTRINNALADDAGWSASQGTKAAFAKQVIADMVRDRVQAAETRMAREAAIAAVSTPGAIAIT